VTDERKPYEAPQVIDLGTLEDITRKNTGTASDSAKGVSKT
jgi:hypothetical protein